MQEMEITGKEEQSIKMGNMQYSIKYFRISKSSNIHIFCTASCKFRIFIATVGRDMALIFSSYSHHRWHIKLIRH